MATEKELQAMINEYRRAADAAEALRAEIFAAFEADGIKKAEATQPSKAGDLVTVVTYRAAGKDSKVFDSKKFEEEHAKLYKKYCTKDRAGSKACLQITKKTISA